MRLPEVNERSAFKAESTGHEWDVTFRVARDVNGRMVISRLEIRPKYSSALDVFKAVPAGGITARLLRSLRLTRDKSWAASWVVKEFRAMARKAPQSARGRPRVYSDAFYKKVAARHRALCRKRSGNVVPRLCKTFGFSRTAMHAFVRRCRKLGFLE